MWVFYTAAEKELVLSLCWSICNKLMKDPELQKHSAKVLKWCYMRGIYPSCLCQFSSSFPSPLASSHAFTMMCFCTVTELQTEAETLLVSCQSKGHIFYKPQIHPSIHPRTMSTVTPELVESAEPLPIPAAYYVLNINTQSNVRESSYGFVLILLRHLCFMLFVRSFAVVHLKPFML